ncbi:MAG: aromatic amino acid ammonia-lyase [Arenicellales bacterium]
MKQDHSSTDPAPPVSEPEQITLTGRSLTAERVERAARRGAKASLAPEAWQRIEAGRRIVEQAIDSGTPLYGVTNGLGSRANERLPREILADFSRNTIRGRSGAMGEPLPADVVRALMVIRLNTLSIGGAGASRAVVETLLEVLNAGLIPEMPETASIGSSDLCVMAHLGLALIGEGAFVDPGARWVGAASRPARAVLEANGIAPLEPGPKDGLVLCSSSAFTAARSALALVDALRALETAQTTAAMSMEGYRGNPSPLDARVSAARPQPGQEQAAEGMRRRLQGSRLFRPDGPRRLQDPLSFRCLAPTHGAGFAAFDLLRSALDAELNGAGENPLVLVEDGTALSTGNFQMPLLTVALDAAGQALSHAALGAVGRCSRMMAGEYAGLPGALSPHWPGGSGFAPLMKTADALLAQIRHDAMATPAELSAGASGVEDTMANAPFAAKKLQRLIGHLEQVLAIEAATAAQAIDLAGVRDTLPPAVAAAYTGVRELMPVLEWDRPLGGEVSEVCARLVRTGILARL